MCRLQKLDIQFRHDSRVCITYPYSNNSSTRQGRLSKPIYASCWKMYVFNLPIQ